MPNIECYKFNKGKRCFINYIENLITEICVMLFFNKYVINEHNLTREWLKETWK